VIIDLNDCFWVCGVNIGKQLGLNNGENLFTFTGVTPFKVQKLTTCLSHLTIKAIKVH
jgi:hypothetical protein